MTKLLWVFVIAAAAALFASVSGGCDCLDYDPETNQRVCWEHETITVPLEDWQSDRDELKWYRERDKRCGR